MNRIVIAVLSILVAYAAVYFGNGLHSFWGQENELAFPLVFLVSYVVTLVGVVVAIVGGLFWVVAMSGAIKDKVDDKTAYLSAAALILLSMIFGLLAAPLAQGPYPWQWVNMWSIIPALAIVPMVLTFLPPKKD